MEAVPAVVITLCLHANSDKLLKSWIYLEGI